MVNTSNPDTMPTARPCGVVYFLVCECNSFYIGKTIQEFWQRAYRRITSMKMCNPNLPLDRHVTRIPEGICPKFYFLLIDSVHTGIRGGDANKILLQFEQRWIFRLKATQPPGLNGSISYRPFLEGFTSGGTELDPDEPH